MLKRVGCIGIASYLLGFAFTAWTMESTEGTLIGDQGYYWTTPAEVWIFPHRLGNIDNRVMLQYNGMNKAFMNVEPEQMGPGGGLVLEVAHNLNLGLWLSTYNAPHGLWLDNAVTLMGWNTFVGNDPTSFPDDAAPAIPGFQNATDELGLIDPYIPGLTAPRKGDLFISYWLENLGLELGLRLWYGSASHKYKPDDSIGPIDIDADSNPNTPGNFPQDIGVNLKDKLRIKQGHYALSDFGGTLGAGYRGLKDWRADFGLQANGLGVSWEPNGIKKYVKAAGSNVAVQVRSHYKLSQRWTIGGFFRFAHQAFGVKPLKQRDGGSLKAMYDPVLPDDRSNLPTPDGTPPIADPTDPGNELTPVKYLKWTRGQQDFQVAGLVRFNPVSRVQLYAALGVQGSTTKYKLSVKTKWFAEQAIQALALPFLHVGFEGKVFKWLDVFLGATKDWRSVKAANTYFDRRIPANHDAQGPAGTPTNPGEEDNTNAKRRKFTTSVKVNNAATDSTMLMLGTRIHVGPFQLVGHVDPEMLLSGTYVLSGKATNPWLWVSVIYDWDFDTDTSSGNGTQFSEPTPVVAVISPNAVQPVTNNLSTEEP